MVRDEDLSVKWLRRKPQMILYWLPWAMWSHFHRKLLLKANQDLHTFGKLALAVQGVCILVLAPHLIAPIAEFGWIAMLAHWLVGNVVWYLCAGMTFAALHMKNPGPRTR